MKSKVLFEDIVNNCLKKALFIENSYEKIENFQIPCRREFTKLSLKYWYIIYELLEIISITNDLVTEKLFYFISEENLNSFIVKSLEFEQVHPVFIEFSLEWTKPTRQYVINEIKNNINCDIIYCKDLIFQIIDLRLKEFGGMNFLCDVFKNFKEPCISFKEKVFKHVQVKNTIKIPKHHIYEQVNFYKKVKDIVDKYFIEGKVKIIFEGE